MAALLPAVLAVPFFSAAPAALGPPHCKRFLPFLKEIFEKNRTNFYTFFYRLSQNFQRTQAITKRRRRKTQENPKAFQHRAAEGKEIQRRPARRPREHEKARAARPRAESQREQHGQGTEPKQQVQQRRKADFPAQRAENIIHKPQTAAGQESRQRL
jgi:hypothetical protein